MNENNQKIDDESVRKSIRIALEKAQWNENNNREIYLKGNQIGMNVVDLVTEIRKSMPDEKIEDKKTKENSFLISTTVDNSDNHSCFKINDLLCGNTNEFLQRAYKVVLNRQPDPTGYNNYIKKLNQTHGDRINVLGSLRYSEEGRRNKTKIKGLLIRYMWCKGKELINKIPIVRTLFFWVVSIFKISKRFEDVYGNLYRINSTLDSVECSFDKLNEQLYGNSQNLENLKKDYYEVNEITKTRLNELRNNIEDSIDSKLREQKINLSEKSDLLLKEYNNINDKKIQDITLKLEEYIKEQSKVENDLISKVYLEFENKFRGTREEIQERLKVYLSIIEKLDIENGHDDTTIVDIGCGRGEWLELLKNNRFRHIGVDLNSDMIKECNNLNLHAVKGDALEYLKSLPDESIHAITGFHIVEHVGIDTLIYILYESKRVLKSKGVIIFETPNPENLIVGACNFYIDPTHKTPIPPMQLQFLVEHIGMKNVEIMRLHPYNAVEIEESFAPEKVMSKEIHSIAEFFNHAADYSIIAYKE